MSRAVLATAGDDPDTDINFAAGCFAGADLFFLGRKIETSLAEIVLAVIALSIVCCDVTSLALPRTLAAQVAQGQAHPGILSVFAHVATCSVDFLLGHRSVVQQEVCRIVR